MIDTTIDFNFGVENEKKLLETLSKKHNNLTLTSKYCLYDFMNDTTLIELKSRRIKHNDYNSSMIQYKKIEYFLKSPKKCYCYFSYLDGLYYFEVNKENVDKCRIGFGGRSDRGKKEIYKMLYIPIELLIKH